MEKMVCGGLGGGFVVGWEADSKKSAVRKLAESEISYFDFLKTEHIFFFKNRKKKQKNFF